jgi:UDPglucose 6-dehydrogenase
MRIAVVGLGKLGAPLAAVLASKGNEVLGIDVNPEAVRLLNEGSPPVDEPGLEELVSASRERLKATTDLAAAADTEVSIILVPTPSDERGAFSNEHVLAAVEEIGRALAGRDDYHVLVVASTVMPGSCEAEIRPALESASGRRVGETLGLCYSPEFIALGSVIRDMLEPDMVLIGESDGRAGQVLEDLYAGVCENDPPFRRMSLVNAELTKIAVNTYVTMKISYANTLAELSERLPGADVGPCFPRDNKAFGVLARDLGAEPLLAEATDAVNVAQTERLARAVQSRLEPGGAVGILGLSYKPDTGVIEESPGLALAMRLANAGYAVHVYDPVATDAALGALDGQAHGCSSAAELLELSDVAVIATPWPEFAQLPIEALEREGRRAVVIDCWRVLPQDRPNGNVEIVRLGRALEAASPV